MVLEHRRRAGLHLLNQWVGSQSPNRVFGTGRNGPSASLANKGRTLTISRFHNTYDTIGGTTASGVIATPLAGLCYCASVRVFASALRGGIRSCSRSCRVRSTVARAFCTAECEAARISSARLRSVTQFRWRTSGDNLSTSFITQTQMPTMLEIIQVSVTCPGFP